MTPNDSARKVEQEFEAWWNKHTRRWHTDLKTLMMKDQFHQTWTAAHQAGREAQREADAKICLDHCLEDGQPELCCGLEIEAAIRAQSGQEGKG